MVPKSPIEQPIRHQVVLMDARRQVDLHRQSSGVLGGLSLIISERCHDE